MKLEQPNDFDEDKKEEDGMSSAETMAILTQFRKEKKAAQYQRLRFLNAWIQNEQLYNGNISKSLLTKSNIHIPVLFGECQNVKTRLGKIPDVKFYAMLENGDIDESASDLMFQLWTSDIDNTDLYSSSLEDKFEDSKIDCAIYSRAIFKLNPTNERMEFEKVDPLSFLICPAFSELRDTPYCGIQFIYTTMDELEKNKDYDQNEVKKMKEINLITDKTTGSLNSTSNDKSIRDIRIQYAGLQDINEAGIDTVELNEWYTIYNGNRERWIIANDEFLLERKPLKDTLKKLDTFPFFSFATYKRGVTFWQMSVADLYRDLNLAMNVVLNQDIDNRTYSTFNMSWISSTSGLKQNSFSPAPGKLIAVNVPDGTKIKDHILPIVPRDISNGQGVATLLKGYIDSSSMLRINPQLQKGKQTATQAGSDKISLDENVKTIRRSINICFKEMAKFYAEIMSYTITKPRNLSVSSGNESIPLSNVNFSNFQNVKEWRVEVIDTENNTENEIIQQNKWTKLYEILSENTNINGKNLLEMLLRKYGLKEFEIKKVIQEVQPQGIQGQEGQGQVGEQKDIDPNLSQTQKIASQTVAR